MNFNNISLNKYGLRLNKINSSVIRDNYFVNNSDYAITVSSWDSNSINTSIHHNVFIDNNPDGSSQAQGGGLNILWYDISTNEGNFWSDWTGTGIYDINGTPNDDLYPLENPP